MTSHHSVRTSRVLAASCVRSGSRAETVLLTERDDGPFGRRFHAPVAVLSAPAWLAIAATRTAAFRHAHCPVVLVGSSAWFVVAAGEQLDPDLAQLRGVSLASPGELCSAQSGVRQNAAALWWISPEDTGRKPGNLAAVEAAFRAALLC